MPYCTVQDIAGAIRIDVLLGWAKDDSRENDAFAYGRVEAAIARADEEINLYIGRAASLPLPSVPAALRDCAVSVAIYKVASRRGIVRDSADQTVRQNYEDALKLLQKIADGKVSLGLGTDNSAVPTASQGIASSFPPSRMTGERKW